MSRGPKLLRISCKRLAREHQRRVLWFEYYLLQEKWKNPQQIYHEYGLVITYYGIFLRDLLIEYTHPFLKKPLDGKINHTLTKIKHIFGIFSYLNKTYKTVDPLLSSKTNEMNGSQFIYRIFCFKKNHYTLHILRIYS